MHQDLINTQIGQEKKSVGARKRGRGNDFSRRFGALCVRNPLFIYFYKRGQDTKNSEGRSRKVGFMYLGKSEKRGGSRPVLTFSATFDDLIC